MRSVKDIPVFFHNLGGYDSHIIFKSLNKVTLDGTPTVIAKSMEKFVCFKIHKLHFKDTLQFLGSSLDKLVSNLAAKTKNGQTLESIFPNLDKYFQDKWAHIHKEGFELLTRKGVYPYEYMDDFSKMEETSLPPKEKFLMISPRSTLVMKIIRLCKIYGIHSSSRIWVNSMICIWSWMFFFRVMCLKDLEIGPC